ncbi:thioredoxin family protein [Pedobacter sp. P351]|uniref:thioredoxin family protein n=1 Tax=Pedobacter superstes TaxID=3133441 RepID=UPI0030A5BCFD
MPFSNIIKVVIFCIVVCHSSTVVGQVKTVEFEQLGKLQVIEKKPVLVFIQTDWCKYCNQMKQSLKKDQLSTEILNQKFYVVYFNAEERRTISFAGREFRFKPTGATTGVHELAEALGTIDGSLSYPTLCFLNENNEILYQYGAYMDSKSFPKTLQIILRKN